MARNVTAVGSGSDYFLQHLAQPAASVQHLAHVAWSEQHAPVQAAFLWQVVEQPVVRKIPATVGGEVDVLEENSPQCRRNGVAGLVGLNGDGGPGLGMAGHSHPENKGAEEAEGTFWFHKGVLRSADNYRWSRGRQSAFAAKFPRRVAERASLKPGRMVGFHPI